MLINMQETLKFVGGFHSKTKVRGSLPSGLRYPVNHVASLYLYKTLLGQEKVSTSP